MTLRNSKAYFGRIIRTGKWGGVRHLTNFYFQFEECKIFKTHLAMGFEIYQQEVHSVDLQDINLHVSERIF